VQRLGAEHFAHRRGQRLGAVEHHQQPVVVAQAAGDEVGQQGPDHGLVLGGALPQPDRLLRAVGGDPQRDDHAALGQVLAVEHEHHDVLTGQVAGHQLGQRGLGLLDEPTRDRRARRRLLPAADLLADRLAGAGVAAGGHPGQHPLHHHPGEHVIGGEVRVAGQRHLMAVGGARPRPGHRDPAAAESDRAAPAAMAHRGPIRVVRALRPARLGDLGLEHRLHHRHPGGHAHRQQPLARNTGDVGHRQPDLRRQLGQPGGIGSVSEANGSYGLHGGPLPSFEVFLAVHPKTYQPAGLR
jgi:hypothetical protein